MSNLVNFIFSQSRLSLIPVAIVNTIAGIDYVILRLHELEGVVIVRLDFLLITFVNNLSRKVTLSKTCQEKSDLMIFNIYKLNLNLN